MAWLAVNQDGTENIFNAKPFRGDKYPEICKKYNITYSEKDKFKGKWYDTYTDGYFQVPKNNGVQLPLGSIQKLIGKSITWADKPVKI